MPLIYRLLLITMLVAEASLARSVDPEMYESAVSAFEQGDYLTAATTAEQAVQAAPGHLDSRLVLARSYHIIFESVGLYYAEAVGAYEKLVAQVADTMEAWDSVQKSRVFLGQLYLRGGDYDKGLHHLTRFLDIQPEFRDADVVWNSIGVAYYYKNEYRHAVSAFEAAVQANAEFEPARFNLRSVFTRLGMFDQAMASLRVGRKDLALQDLENLLLMAPRYMPAVLHRALLLHDLGQDAEAERVALRSLALRPDRQTAFELRMLLGDIAALRGEPEHAIEHYRRCLRIQPGYLQVVEKINAMEDELRLQGARSRDPEDASAASSPSPTTTTDVNQFPM